jgi:hypothetical protein
MSDALPETKHPKARTIAMLTLGVLLAALAAGPDDEAGPKTLYRPEMFETLVNPDCSHCVDEARKKAGVLHDDDRVLAWTRGQYDGGAIPHRWFLGWCLVLAEDLGDTRSGGSDPPKWRSS